MPVYKNVTKRVYFQSLLTTGADNTATTPTVKIVKDGGAQATATNTPSHLGTGQWMLVLTATEMNADEVSVNHSASGCVSGVVTVYPEADYTSTRAGLVDNLNATITSRMASYTQPTGFLAATFPTTVASTTNITAATGIVLSGVTHTGAVIPTVSAVTGLTASNLDATVSSRSTYAGGAVASVTGSVGSVTGLTASNLDVAVSTRMATYTQPTGFLAATFPGSVGTSTYAGGAVASVTAGVTVTTNNDKTGYGLSSAAVQAIWDALTSALTTVGSIGKLLVTNIDALISSRSTYAGADTSGTTTLLTRVGTPAGASVSADVAAVKAVLPSALVSGRIDASVGAMAAGVQTTASFAVGAIDNTVLSSNAEQAIADKTLATAVDGTITLRQLLQLIGASAVGKLSGAATTTVTIRNVSDTVNAVVATVDADGNRSATTYTVT